MESDILDFRRGAEQNIENLKLTMNIIPIALRRQPLDLGAKQWSQSALDQQTK